jgi:hypothetical protein
MAFDANGWTDQGETLMENREAAAITLPRDEFTVRRRELEAHPEAVAASSRIDVVDPYGNVITWVLDLYRLEGHVTAFVQRGAAEGDYKRLVIPPAVTAAITRHQSSLVTKHRRKVAKRVVADRRARGEQVGNPAALAAARKRKR